MYQISKSAPWPLLFKRIPEISRLLRNDPDRIISLVVNIFCAVNGKGYLVNVSEIMKQASCQVFLVSSVKARIQTEILWIEFLAGAFALSYRHLIPGTKSLGRTPCRTAKANLTNMSNGHEEFRAALMDADFPKEIQFSKRLRCMVDWYKKERDYQEVYQLIGIKHY